MYQLLCAIDPVRHRRCEQAFAFDDRLVGKPSERGRGVVPREAATAEQWGYVNRALPDGDLRPFVEALAQRIASFPPASVARAKAAIDAARADPISGLLLEAQQFHASLGDPETHPRLEAFMELGGQTRAAEIRGFTP